MGRDLLVPGRGDLTARDPTAEDRGLSYVNAVPVALGFQPRIEAARGRVSDEEDAQSRRGGDVERCQLARFVARLPRIRRARRVAVERVTGTTTDKPWGESV